MWVIGFVVVQSKCAEPEAASMMTSLLPEGQTVASLSLTS